METSFEFLTTGKAFSGVGLMRSRQRSFWSAYGPARLSKTLHSAMDCEPTAFPPGSPLYDRWGTAGQADPACAGGWGRVRGFDR